MTFEEYLKSKKINSDSFQNIEQELWNRWKKEFEQMHPESFTAQKKFLLNDIRRRFRLEIPQQ